MATYQHFEDLPSWQEAARLYQVVLDLLEEPGLPLSSGFRSQLDRAALSVSNNIAEGFERVTTNELLAFLAIARGSAGEVRSMIAVVRNRPKLEAHISRLQRIRALAESCSRQLTAWACSLEDSPIQGNRHLTRFTRTAKQTADAAQGYRRQFLRSLTPEHPLYDTPEARLARSAPQYTGEK